MIAARRLRPQASWRLSCGAAAVAILAGAAIATPGAPPPDSPAGSVEVTWSAAEGDGFRIAIPQPVLDRHRANRAIALRQAEAEILARLEAAAAAEASAIAATLMAGLPAYTDWLYGWIESYVASYLIALQAAETVGTALGQGEVPRPLEALRDAMQAVAGDRFRQHVLAPADIAPRLVAARQRMEAMLARDLARLEARERSVWEDLLRTDGSVLGSAPAPARAACPAAAAAGQAQGLEALEPEHGHLLALRYLRPYAARGTLVGFRAGFGDVLGLPGGSGLSLAALLTTNGLLALAGTTAVVWTADWLINRLDGVLGRPAMEATIAAAIDQARQAEEEAMMAPLRLALTQRIACAAEPG